MGGRGVILSKVILVPQKILINKTSTFWPNAPNSDVSRVFLGRPVDTSNPGRCHHHVWCRAKKFSKFVSPDTLKMDYLTASLLGFLHKTLFKLLELSLQKTPSWMLFKKSYIHIPNLSSYKLVRAAKQSELKRCSK